MSLNSERKWVLKILVSFYIGNILLHVFCIGLWLILGPLDGWVFFEYVYIVLPISSILAILIFILNLAKRIKSVKFENYMILFSILTFVLIDWSENSSFIRRNLIDWGLWSSTSTISTLQLQIVVAVFSLLGIVISLGVIRNLKVQFEKFELPR